MRELGRFLVAVKSKDSSVNCLTDLISPTMYNVIMRAAKEVAGFDEERGTYETPSLVIKIGQTLIKCASRYKEMCMDDEVMHDNLRRIDLFQEG